MQTKHLKVFRGIWLAAVAILICVLAERQIASTLSSVRAGTSLDFHVFQVQGHLLLRKVWVLLSYFVLLASALVYLFGPGRDELKNAEGRWLLAALIFSAVVYGYWIIRP